MESMTTQMMAPRRVAALLAAAALTCGLTACEGSKKQAQPTSQPPAQVGARGAPDGPSAHETKSKDFALKDLEHRVVVGEDGVATFKVVPGSGLKINPEYPWKVALDAEASSKELALGTAAVDKAKMTFTDAAASIPVPLQAKTAGTHTVAANVNLSVCEKGNEARCLWFRDEPVDLTITAVADADAPDQPHKEQ